MSPLQRARHPHRWHHGVGSGTTRIAIVRRRRTRQSAMASAASVAVTCHHSSCAPYVHVDNEDSPRSGLSKAVHAAALGSAVVGTVAVVEQVVTHGTIVRPSAQLRHPGAPLNRP